MSIYRKTVNLIKRPFNHTPKTATEAAVYGTLHGAGIAILGTAAAVVAVRGVQHLIEKK